MKRTRYTAKDFSWVDWKREDFEKVAKKVVRLKKERYAAIRAIPAKGRTFDNTVYALASSDDDITDWLSAIGLLKETSTDPALRKAAGDVAEKLLKQLVEIEHDPRIYEALKEYAVTRPKLVGADKILFEDYMKNYARMGFGLPKAKQARLKANIKELGKLGIAFSRNLNEYKDYILVTEKELDGLPETYKQSLAREGEMYKIALSYPDSVPFMSGAHNEMRRKELEEKLLRKGGAANVSLLSRMIKLRDENAKLLGYSSHFDYKTELRMAKSAANVHRFLLDLERRTRKPVKKDFDMLLAEKRRRTGNPKAQLGTHDISYLFKQIRKEKFDIDSDLVKEYFPFEHVKNATLEAYQKLLGVSFKRKNRIVLWHEDVQLYEIFDKNGEYLSAFALDLYPRDGKYGHAAAFDVIYGRQEGTTYRAPFASMVTNFSKPTAANPSLMSHREVETFFHEFGHIMHFTLTEAKYSDQAGFNVAHDFVEAPSQMLENWVWDPKMLTLLSKHYKTGKPLPKELVKKMIDAKLFGEAWGVRGQVVLALLDYTLHTKGAKKPNNVYPMLEKKLLGLTPPKSQLWLAGFGHLAGGYDAGYYGYLWSRVYAEDMFTRFTKEGILNPKTGRDYRNWILAKGSSMDEAELVKGFLGRKPNNKAFIRSIGA